MDRLRQFRPGRVLWRLVAFGALAGFAGAWGGCAEVPILRPHPRPVARETPSPPQPAPVVGTVPNDAGLPTAEERVHDPAKTLMTLPAIDAATRSLGVPVVPPPATQAAPAEPPAAAVKLYIQGREKFLEHANLEAMTCLDQSLQLDPNAFAVLRLMGRVCFAADQYARGSLYLQKAAAIHPDDVEVNFLLGRYWVQRREWPAAIHYLLAAHNSPGQSPDSSLVPLTHFFLAEALDRAGYTAAAVQQYEAFLALIGQPLVGYRNDRELTFLIDRAWAVELAAAEDDYALKRYDGASRHYQAALEHDPGNAYIRGRMVAADAERNNLPAAEKQAVQLVAATHARPDAVNLLLWLYGREGKNASSELAARASQGDGDAALALSAVQQQNGNADDALATLSAYARTHPKDQVALDRLLAMATSRTDPAAVVSTLAAVLHADPSRQAAVVDAVKTRFTARQAADALPALRQPAGPEDAASRDYVVGLVAERAGDAVQAEQSFRRSLHSDDTFFPAYRGLVETLLTAEHFEPANQLVQQAVDQHLGGARAYELWVKSETVQNRFTNALKIARRAQRQFPDDPELGMLAVNLHLLRHQPTDARDELTQLVNQFPQYEPAYRKMVEAQLAARDVDGAVATATQLLKQNPHSPYGRLLAAQLYAQSGQVDESIALITQLVKDDPTNTEPVLALASLQHQAARDADAEATLRAGLRQTPDAEPLAQALVELQNAEGKTDAAVATCKGFSDAHPGSTEWLTLYAAELLAAERKNDAEILLRAALDKDPRNETLAVQLATFLQDNDRPAEAAAVLDQLVAAAGPTTERLYLLSHTQEQAGQNDASVASLQKVLSILPDHAGANNDLGYWWADRGEHLAQAQAMVERAVANDPNNPAFIDSLGWVLYKQGKFQEAADQLEKAVALPGGEEPELLGHLADAQYRLGKKEDALKRYSQAADLLNATSPLTPEQKKVRDQITKKLTQARAGQPVDVSPVGKTQ